MKALRVVLDPVLSTLELMQHVVLKQVPPHPKMGDLITATVLDARPDPLLYP